jgi:hypothetical protein
MRKRSKKSKAILGAVALALLGFAEAKAGVVLQRQRLADASLRSSELRGRAALSRLPVTALTVGLAKKRRPANNSIAYSWIVSFSHGLRFAEAVSSPVRPACGQSRRYTTSPRAPPIS